MLSAVVEVAMNAAKSGSADAVLAAVNKYLRELPCGDIRRLTEEFCEEIACITEYDNEDAEAAEDCDYLSPTCDELRYALPYSLIPMLAVITDNDVINEAELKLMEIEKREEEEEDREFTEWLRRMRAMLGKGPNHS